LALDEPNDDDEIQTEDSFKVIIERGLLGQLGGVNIDYRENRWMGSGFFVRPIRTVPGSCSC
jgi:Fe-S cluster assembly iron-binding protein IscA